MTCPLVTCLKPTVVTSVMCLAVTCRGRNPTAATAAARADISQTSSRKGNFTRGGDTLFSAKLPPRRSKDFLTDTGEGICKYATRPSAGRFRASPAAQTARNTPMDRGKRGTDMGGRVREHEPRETKVQTDEEQAHICPAHNRHSQDPPVVERTTHARATRHAANRHGTRAALPTGLMSEHPAVFHVWHTLSECTRISS